MGDDDDSKDDFDHFNVCFATVETTLVTRSEMTMIAGESKGELN